MVSKERSVKQIRGVQNGNLHHSVKSLRCHTVTMQNPQETKEGMHKSQRIEPFLLFCWGGGCYVIVGSSL